MHSLITPVKDKTILLYDLTTKQYNISHYTELFKTL